MEPSKSAELKNAAPASTRDTGREDRVVGLVLRIGAYASVALILCGGAAFLIHAERAGRYLLEAGVLVLMSTPITRVMTAGLVFWREGDRRYALVSLGVFLVLILSSMLAVFKILPSLEH